MGIADFSKYFRARERAKARAQETMRALQRELDASHVPAALNPLNRRFEEELLKVMYEGEMLSEQHKQG